MKPGYLKSMQTLHAAFYLPMLGLMLLAGFQNREKAYISFVPDGREQIYTIVAAVGLALIILSGILFRAMTVRIQDTKEIDQRLGKYRKASLVKFALLQNAILLQIVGFMASLNLICLVLATLALLIMIAARPSKERLVDVLALVYPDTEKL